MGSATRESGAVIASSSGWIIGQTVPWVAPWTGEADFGLAESVDFPGRTELIQAVQPGEGRPVMDGMHVIRQRQGVTLHLCHVCGRPTPRHDRHLFPVSTGYFTPMKDGSTRYASHLPPVHLACARRAQIACPHLSRTYEQPEPFPEKAGIIACETNAPPLMRDLAASLPPGLKVVFSYVRIHTASFSRRVEKMRARAAAPA